MAKRNFEEMNKEQFADIEETLNTVLSNMDILIDKLDNKMPILLKNKFLLANSRIRTFNNAFEDFKNNTINKEAVKAERLAQKERKDKLYKMLEGKDLFEIEKLLKKMNDKKE